MSGPAAGIGLGMSVASQIVGATQQAGQMRQSAAVDDENARRTLLQGALQEDTIRRRERATSGEALASQGASGLAVGTGSAFDLLYENALERERAVLNTRFSTASQADSLEATAAAKRSAASGALIGGLMGAGAKAIMGISSLRDANALRGAQNAPYTNVSAIGGYRMPIPAAPATTSTYGNGAGDDGQPYWNL